MFLNLNSLVQCSGRIIRKHRNPSLIYNRPRIHTAIHIVHSAAAFLRPGIDSLLPRVNPRKGRQQRGVNVDNTLRKRLQQGSLHQTHESGKADDFHPHGQEFFCCFFLNIFRKFRFESLAVNHLCRYSGLTCSFQYIGIGVIRQHNTNFRRQFPRLDRIKNGLKVGTGARTQYT